MGSDLTDGDSLQGVIIPDQRLTFWSSQSSGVTEASPYPGVVTPDRHTGHGHGERHARRPRHDLSPRPAGRYHGL